MSESENNVRFPWAKDYLSPRGSWGSGRYYTHNLRNAYLAALSHLYPDCVQELRIVEKRGDVVQDERTGECFYLRNEWAKSWGLVEKGSARGFPYLIRVAGERLCMDLAESPKVRLQLSHYCTPNGEGYAYSTADPGPGRGVCWFTYDPGLDRDLQAGALEGHFKEWLKQELDEIDRKYAGPKVPEKLADLLRKIEWAAHFQAGRLKWSEIIRRPENSDLLPAGRLEPTVRKETGDERLSREADNRKYFEAACGRLRKQGESILGAVGVKPQRNGRSVKSREA